MNCNKEFGQFVIPVFYGLDPSHVREQKGEFGNNFQETCKKNTTKKVKNRWKECLTDVASMPGYHSKNWDGEASMIEQIATDVLGKLKLTPSDDFVGLEDHIAKLSILLHLESEETRMVGIWGSSGIGKTTIARALFSRLSRHFQGSVFIDRHVISKSMEISSGGSPNEYNMKLHLPENFLSKILDQLGVEGGRQKHPKVVIFIDDLDHQEVLHALAGQTHCFGRGSRIIVTTKDRHLLRAYGVDYIYEVGHPSDKLALEMFRRSAFRQNCPPDGFMALASEVASGSGNLPLGPIVLGSSIRGRDKDYWMDMLLRLQNGLDGKIDMTFSNGGLEDKAIFRHISNLFNGAEIADLKLLLEDSNLGVENRLSYLIDECIVHVRCNRVDMHYLLQGMGKEIIRTHSNELGRLQVLIDLRDICDVLHNSTPKLKLLCWEKYPLRSMPFKFEYLSLTNMLDLQFEKLLLDEDQSLTGLKKMVLVLFKTQKEILDLPIAANLEQIDLSNCRSLVEIPSSVWDLNKLEKLYINLQSLESIDLKGNLWVRTLEAMHIPESLVLLRRVRVLHWVRYPGRCIPSEILSENLSTLYMPDSKLEKLWDGVWPLTGLRKMDLSGSKKLKEIPDLSMAINLKTLRLNNCSSLVELPTSIQHLNKLKKLDMRFCENLEILPTGINLQSLNRLSLEGCSRLRSFPDISTNILELNICNTGIEEIPSNFYLENLVDLYMEEMMSDKLWEKVQPLTPLMTMLTPSLTSLWLSSIPSLVELPPSVQKFNKLEYLSIRDCVNLETPPTGIYFESLDVLDFSGCSRLRSFPDISTNISKLFLGYTSIEEVPWWIENFSKLSCLHMNGCNNLLHVSLNMSKLKYLEEVDFSDCTALTEASWNDSLNKVTMATDHIHSKLPVPHEVSSPLPDNSSPKLKISLINCFNLDQGALYHTQSVFFKSMELSGEEVPTYFTHRTTGSTLTIPLRHTSSPSKPLLKFRACAVVDFESTSIGYHSSKIEVCCLFIGKPGNHCDIADWPFFSASSRGCHLVVIDCCFPLNEDNAPLAELNYDLVDVQFRLMSDYSQLKLKACGIRLLEDSFLPVCKDDKSNEVNLEGYEAEHSKEFQDNTVEMPSRTWKYDVFPSFSGADVRVTFLSHLVKELDLKLISVFNDWVIERSRSLDTVFKQAIKDSRIAVVVFSINYASSSWCLDDLVEILKCKEESGQMVIPIFYGLYPSDVGKQTGDFGKKFRETSEHKTEEVKTRWKEALTNVANINGYHSVNWYNFMNHYLCFYI